MSRRRRGGVQHIGELLPKVAPRLPSPAERTLLDVGAEIFDKPDPDDADIGFLARHLVQVTLPHRSPGNIPEWYRRNGLVTLSIRPGFMDHRVTGERICVGYPFGQIPRLLLFWIATEAVRTRSPLLELGATLNDFMRDIGLDPNTGGGKRGDAKRLRDQMDRLFRATVSLERRTTKGHLEGSQFRNMEVIAGTELWWDPKEPDQASLFDSWLELGPRFYEAIIADPVPVDLRALRALKQSPMALDLYAWTTYRTYRATVTGKKAFIPWSGLQKQLGAEYNDPKNFRKAAKDALRRVRVVYPALRLSSVPGGIEIHPSRPAVLPGGKD